MAQLSKEQKTDAAFMSTVSGFKSVSELAAAYAEARTAAEAAGAGGGLQVPGEGASDEEVSAFYEALGRPKEASGYSFAKEKGAGGGAEAERFASLSFALGLSEGQAKGVWEAAKAEAASLASEAAGRQERELRAADAALEKEYGDKYGEAVAYLGRGLGNSEGKDGGLY
jgi:hypothetical protein